MVHKGDNGGPFCSCMLINHPTGSIFCHNELWRERAHPISPIRSFGEWLSGWVSQEGSPKPSPVPALTAGPQKHTTAAELLHLRYEEGTPRVHHSVSDMLKGYAGGVGGMQAR